MVLQVFMHYFLFSYLHIIFRLGMEIDECLKKIRKEQVVLSLEFVLVFIFF